MHCRIVQRVLGIRYAQETGALFESLGAHARNFHQFFTGGERSVLCPVIHDVLRQLRAESRYICKQVAACRIQVHADEVDAVLYGLVERFLEFALVYVMLVLSHAD